MRYTKSRREAIKLTLSALGNPVAVAARPIRSRDNSVGMWRRRRWQRRRTRFADRTEPARERGLGDQHV